MNLRLLLRSLPSSLLILRSAAWLVPAQERADWLAEWQAELWHVWHARDSKSRGRFLGSSEVTNFCLGAFRDACWLRWNNPHSTCRRVFRTGSASRCSISLAILTGISLLVCLSLPGVRSAFDLWPYHDADSLLMISSGGYSGAELPSIQFQDYQSWKTSTRHLFTDLAFYQPIRKRVHVTRHRGAELSIGRASDNIFRLLHWETAPIASDKSNGDYSAKLFLSQRAWRESFAGDPHLIGSITEIGGRAFWSPEFSRETRGLCRANWMRGCSRTKGT